MNPPPDESKLDELLDRWEESVEQGKPLSVEELCLDNSELAGVLSERIQALQAMDQLLSEPAEEENLSAAPPEISDEKLVAEIGLQGARFHVEGGLGSIYTARDEQLHREVAVKFLRADHARHQESRERFCLEAEITSRLYHPGVVPVHGIGETGDGRPFYVMQFVRGETLEAAIRRYYQEEKNWNPNKRNLEFRTLLLRFVSVCNALAYAHNRGIIHRDLKPENIMLGKYGETMVVDWGLAMPVKRGESARASGERTLLPALQRVPKRRATDQGAGTPAYMSPEQARGETEIGFASDIYSLGAVLYKILTGQAPVEGAHLNYPEIRKRILEGPRLPPRELNPHCPRPLEAVCDKAMSIGLESRYSDALSLAREVERFLADERVQAYDESSLETPLRWLRQHRGTAQVTVISVLLLFIVLFGSSLWLGQAARKTTAANEELLHSAARLTALTVAMEINDRWRILEMESRDPEMIQRLTPASLHPDQTDWEWLLAWLGRAEREHRSAAQAESWFLCNAQGIQVARIPERASIGESFAHRDYFHGNGLDLAPGETGTPPHIESVYLSAPYASSTDGDMKVAFTIPLWSKRLGLPGRRFLGVLGMSIKLGHFQILQQNLGEDQIAVLVDLDSDRLDGEPRHGLILHHPLFNDELHEAIKDRSLKPPRLDAPLADSLHRFSRRVGEDRVHASHMERNYIDPVERVAGESGTPWIAAFEPVFVDGRDNILKDTRWMVIVQKRLR